MAEPKTRPTGASVPAFLARITSPERRADCKQLNKLMREISGAPAKMWGTAIVGFNSYVLRYADGRELDWPLLAYSPRKQSLTLYVIGLRKQGTLLKKLGRHKVSGGCLHLQSLADVDKAVLTTLLERSVATTRRQHPE
jgi:uncharacterized protein DUF1801